jgi:hypothetical protein
MHPELALKAISYTVISIFLLTLLFVLPISLRKELDAKHQEATSERFSIGRIVKKLHSGEAPIRGIVHLGLGVIGICTFITLMVTYFDARKVSLPHSVSQRLDTATVSQLYRNRHVTHEE